MVVRVTLKMVSTDGETTAFDETYGGGTEAEGTSENKTGRAAYYAQLREALRTAHGALMTFIDDKGKANQPSNQPVPWTVSDDQEEPDDELTSVVEPAETPRPSKIRRTEVDDSDEDGC